MKDATAEPEVRTINPPILVFTLGPRTGQLKGLLSGNESVESQDDVSRFPVGAAVRGRLIIKRRR